MKMLSLYIPGLFYETDEQLLWLKNRKDEVEFQWTWNEKHTVLFLQKFADEMPHFHYKNSHFTTVS